MKRSKKKAPGSKSGSAKKSSTRKTRSGDEPIIVKPASGDEPIIVKPADSGDEPIIVKPTDKAGAKPAKKQKKTPILIRPGKKSSVNVLLDTADTMGWTLVNVKGVTTIIIPEGAAWNVKKDRTTGRLFLEGTDKVIAKLKVDDMVDTKTPSKEVPSVQVPKPGNDPEIEIHLEGA